MKVYQVSIRAVEDGGQYLVRVRASSPQDAVRRALRGVDIYGFEFPVHDFERVLGVSLNVFQD